MKWLQKRLTSLHRISHANCLNIKLFLCQSCHWLRFTHEISLFDYLELFIHTTLSQTSMSPIFQLCSLQIPHCERPDSCIPTPGKQQRGAAAGSHLPATLPDKVVPASSYKAIRASVIYVCHLFPMCSAIAHQNSNQDKERGLNRNLNYYWY